MIYELRIYHTLPGRLADLNARFVNHTLKLWEDKYKFRPVGFWTPLIGDSNVDLYYILEWDSLADREKKWNAFVSDPEWLAMRAETEKDGQLVSHITNLMLTPTAFSKLR
jgi:hypothetical protein